ncbi:condensin-2 complex subunit G2 [Dryobates pubescens]|uniref:condensin-2 complex subunit G2 n=1 Tax=Dryobates pubescens TaxID=118200 RepID=UPI0023B9E035|nr:condensin-2 complex subunit G2 [Dryobates pubescens]
MKREEFLQVVHKESIEDFLRYTQKPKNTFDPFDLNELLQELSRKHKEVLWERLTQLLSDCLMESPVETWPGVAADDMDVDMVPEMKQTVAVIQGVTVVVTASIPAVDKTVNYKALLECVFILNGILLALPGSQKILRDAIQHICEMWWEKGLEGKEQLGKTLCIILLRKSLNTAATGADIVRVWNLHQTLLCFDYDSEDSSEVKDLLLQCFMSVKHIKKEEGRRFLSFLFTWNVNFIKMIHGTVKNQLQFFPRSLMEYISEVYFRAWKKVSGEFLQVLEHNCIQDFMHHGIHLPRSSSVHSKVREILSYIHKQSKVRQGAEEMLYRLYQPILWRALKARNSEVRSNAAFLFVDAFPLRDPSFSNAEMDGEIQKQFEELYSLLEDSHPVVRSTGALGTTQITSRYWEMIPSAVLADLLKKLTGELACDATSADVRSSVFKCLPVILDNKLSHPLLEKLLPAVRNSLHDSSEKVRVAFVDMLLKVKATKAAKFWNICPMDHLLTRLAVDSRPVSRRIVNLLFDSFFPINQPKDVWCERCVTLIQMNSAAARKFYQYAYEYTAPTNIAKLMLTIRRCLNACIRKARQESLRDTDDDDDDDKSEKENTSVLNTVLSVDDVGSMAGLLEITVILWRSIRKALDRNEDTKDYAIRKFASVLPEYFREFKDERCTTPLVILASFMPPAAIPTFSCGVISRLRNINNGADQSKYSMLIDCLCRWGQVGHVLELACDWLSDSLTPKKSTNTSGRRVRIQVTHESKPELAADYIEYLLTHPVNCDCLLSVPKKKLKMLLKILSSSKEVLGSILKATDASSGSFSEAAGLRAFSLFCRLSVHLQNKFSEEGKDCLSLLKETGAWIESQVVPFILASDQKDGVSKHNNVSELIIQTYLTVCKDVVMIGLGNATFQARLLDIGLSVIQTERGGFCAPVLLCALKEIVEASLIQNLETDEVANLHHAVQAVFQKVLECVACRLKEQQEKGMQLIHSIQMPLGKFMHAVQCWHSYCPAVCKGVLSTLLAAIIAEISYMLQKASSEKDITIPKTISELPPLSSSLMTIIMKSVNVVRSFLNELMECILSGEIQEIFRLTATVCIVIVIKGKHRASLLMDIAPALQRKLITCKDTATEESGSTERALCESSLKILDEILNP